MRYEEYEKKIIKLAKVRSTIFRFRFAIFLPLAAIIAITGTLIGTKGIVSADASQITFFEYGEKISLSSKAFISDSEFEYSEINSETWTTEVPTMVGRYKARPRAKNSFNSYYYGKLLYIQIIPKDVTLRIYETNITYGNKPTLVDNESLCYKDKIADSYTYSFVADEDDYTIGTYKVSDVSILSESGKDVSECYNIKLPEKSLKILKRKISLTSSSKEKYFDGTSNECADFEISDGTLATGDKITVSETTTQSSTSFGTVKNKQSYQIVNAKNKDVTKYYTITKTNGSLKLMRSPLVLTSDSYEYTYDGENHNLSEDSITLDGTLANGHNIYYEFASTTNPFRNAGSYTNTFTASINDGVTDYTDCYDITYIYGDTLINKRAITIDTGSASKVYDGTNLSSSNCTVTSGSLVSGHSIVVTSFQSIKNVGSTTNSVYFNIADNSLSYVTENYDITLNYGTLTIEPFELNINWLSNSVVYDGKPHKAGYTYSPTSLVGSNYLADKNNPEYTNVGIYPYNDLSVKVMDYGSDNSSNYNITYSNQEGSLQITKRPLTLHLLGHEKTYDNKPITEDDFTRYEILDGTSLADNEYVKINYLTHPKEARDDPYPIEYDIKIYRKIYYYEDPINDIEVTSNYAIDASGESFKINKRQVTINTVDLDHEYDRQTVFDVTDQEEAFSYSGDGLCEGHHLDGLTISCDKINVGTYSYNVDASHVRVLDSNNNDVSSNYSLTFINTGHLTIRKRIAYVSLIDASHTYDGQRFYSSEYTAERLLEGDYLTFEGLPYVKYVEDGYVQNMPTSHKVFMENGEEVSNNYQCTIYPGYIHINPRPITIKIPSYEKVFDNIPLALEASIEVVQGSIVEGDLYMISYMTSRDDGLLHAGTYTNEATLIFYNEERSNISQSYAVTFIYGAIKIKPRPVSINIREENIEYDDLDHDKTYSQSNVTKSSSDVYISSSEEMLPNFRLSASATITGMHDAGVYDDFSTSTQLYYLGNIYAYPNDFNITFKKGSQIISKRNLSLKPLGGSKIYDGEDFFEGLEMEDKYIIQSGSLAAGHSIILTVSSAIEPGQYVISITSAKVVNSSNVDVTKNYNLTLLTAEVRIYEV